MLNVALAIAFALVAAAFVLSVVRLLRGPHAPDRILALDTLYINAIALLVLLRHPAGSPSISRPRC
jgi:multicomponent K+:H+ antiporter subunit F